MGKRITGKMAKKNRRKRMEKKYRRRRARRLRQESEVHQPEGELNEPGEEGVHEPEPDEVDDEVQPQFEFNVPGEEGVHEPEPDEVDDEVQPEDAPNNQEEEGVDPNADVRNKLINIPQEEVVDLNAPEGGVQENDSGDDEMNVPEEGVQENDSSHDELNAPEEGVQENDSGIDELNVPGEGVQENVADGDEQEMEGKEDGQEENPEKPVDEVEPSEGNQEPVGAVEGSLSPANPEAEQEAHPVRDEDSAKSSEDASQGNSGDGPKETEDLDRQDDLADRNLGKRPMREEEEGVNRSGQHESKDDRRRLETADKFGIAPEHHVDQSGMVIRTAPNDDGDVDQDDIDDDMASVPFDDFDTGNPLGVRTYPVPSIHVQDYYLYTRGGRGDKAEYVSSSSSSSSAAAFKDDLCHDPVEYERQMAEASRRSILDTERNRSRQIIAEGRRSLADDRGDQGGVVHHHPDPDDGLNAAHLLPADLHAESDISTTAEAAPSSSSSVMEDSDIEPVYDRARQFLAGARNSIEEMLGRWPDIDESRLMQASSSSNPPVHQSGDGDRNAEEMRQRKGKGVYQSDPDDATPDDDLSDDETFMDYKEEILDMMGVPPENLAGFDAGIPIGTKSNPSPRMMKKMKMKNKAPAPIYADDYVNQGEEDFGLQEAMRLSMLESQNTRPSCQHDATPDDDHGDQGGGVVHHHPDPDDGLNAAHLLRAELHAEFGITTTAEAGPSSSSSAMRGTSTSFDDKRQCSVCFAWKPRQNMMNGLCECYAYLCLGCLSKCLEKAKKDKEVLNLPTCGFCGQYLRIWPYHPPTYVPGTSRS
ncbi:OLC1v1001599C1 [Oldenlandia corymbosa var. corymbosa]|uniref:OLC1v1001599C1 n=1 Tax=Oldenlandia corymbosa var. corymbosa TaxID=529605 RepID=A0AAV1D8G0_OLDCO|nr:OLC1v1001599C1 [Oldenlandia corymbosa var. corymbosa]